MYTTRNVHGVIIASFLLAHDACSFAHERGLYVHFDSDHCGLDCCASRRCIFVPLR